MSYSTFGRFIKYSIVGGLFGATALSLHDNQYQWDSIGIVRLGRATITAFKVGTIYKTQLYSSDLEKDSPEYLKLKSQVYKKSAEKLLDLCCLNKGVYIKVGQHMAALDYILPTEFVETMKVLHSHAPSNDIRDVHKVLREEFKKEPLELFKHIDPEPLGTASLAQVHKAELHDGTIVAIKVQHPYVQGNAQVDMNTMEYLVKIMGYIFPDFKFQWLVDESKKNIPRELNFEEEGQNAEKIGKMFESTAWLKIPKVRWDLTTKRVLTMEFVEGGQVNDLQYIRNNNINPCDVSDKLGRLYSEMIFINGFVHSDPHPGNILIRKSERGDCDVILLDHGLYAVLNDEFRVNYANLWLSILDRDRKAMRKYSKNLGIEGDLYGILACMVTGRTWESINQGITRKLKPTKGEKEYVKREFPSILPQIANILDNVNRQMLLVLKTNDLIRGIEYTLKTNARMGAFKVMSHCCIKSIYDEKCKNSPSKLRVFTINFARYWTLFKLNLYYIYLNVLNYSDNIR